MYYFVSDIHLGGGGEEAARATELRFVAWLDAVSKDAEVIFLVGDIFDFWFEYKRVVPKGFVRTLGKLAELTDRGIRVVFFTGNHDMWVGDYLTRECGVEVITSPRLMCVGGQQLFLAHGDNMQIDGQLVLKLLNKVFRSRSLKWAFSWCIHPNLAQKFGLWWSNKSRKKHIVAGLYDESLTEPLIAYARTYAATHKVDHFVFGHTHFPRDYRAEGLHVVNLGGWDRAAAYAQLDDAGMLTLKRLDS